MSLNVILPDESATMALGAKLAGLLRPGDVVALEGDLGAGKTTLVRGLVGAAGGGETVPSPTFTLVQVYELGAFTLWHFDLYRLERPEDIWELGFEDALDNGVSVFEWPARAGELLPDERLTIHLSHTDGGREAHIEGSPDWQQRMDRMKD